MNEQIRDASLIESKKKLVSGSYLRNAWYVAAWSDELGDGGALGRTILKEPVALYRKTNGGVAAVQDRCSHRFAPLSMGKLPIKITTEWFEGRAHPESPGHWEGTLLPC